MNKNYYPKYSRSDFELVKAGTAPKTKKYDGVTYHDGQLWSGRLPIVLVEDHQEFVRKLYDDPEHGFAGRDKLYNYVKTKYVGISRRDILTCLKNLETNQVHSAPPKVMVSRPFTPKRPLERWTCDTMFVKDADDEEKFIILTCIDTFSKYAWARFIEPSSYGRASGEETTRVMREILKGEGGQSHMPSVIQSDNGVEFKNTHFEKLLAEYNIKHIYSPSHQPTANAIIERFNGTLKRRLYKFMSNYNAMNVSDDDLALLMRGYNNQVHSTTGLSPIQLHTGKKAPVRIARKNINNRAEKIVEKYSREFPEVNVGDYVRIALRTDPSFRRNTALKKQSYVRQWSYEMFKVVDITTPRKTKKPQYQLAKKNGELLPRKFLRQDLQLVDKKHLVRELEPGEYVVERVLDKKKFGRTTKYLVSWRGWGENSWVTKQKSFQKLIDEYELRIS